MRIIDYYNYIATAAYIITGVAALVFFLRKKNSSGIGKEGKDEKKVWRVLFIIVMLIAAFLRLFRLGAVPYGLQQDEASIGYDAYTLATYGIDRNGYHFPVYPITWGCGGGSPLLIYLNVISISLFGTGVVKLRLIPALLGVLTVLLFYLTLGLIYEDRPYKEEISLFGALFVAICPWHIILSRWSLDSNIMPFNLMLAVWLFILGIKKKSTLIYCLSAAAFSICMYSYGAATIVIPIFLLLICIYALVKKYISIGQLIGAALTFLIIFLPLFIFYAVNYLGLPEIVTDHICFNKFTAQRSGEAFVTFDGGFIKGVLSNLKSLLLAISVGDTSHTLAHYYPGYASLYEFTFPITLTGLIVCIVQTLKPVKADDKEDVYYDTGNFVFAALLLSCFILQLFIVSDINRLVMTFIPFIYFFIKGAEFIFINVRKLFPVFIAVLFIGAISFAKDYFSDFNRWSISIYMPGYGEAITRAYEIAGDERHIYSTYEGLSAPFMLALYYNEYDPYKFYSTVEYKDTEAEFRIAESFGNFTFKLPGDELYRAQCGDVFVVASSELDIFGESLEESGLLVDDFGAYFVVYSEFIN